VQTIVARPFASDQRFSGEVWAVSEAALTVAEAGRVRLVHVAEGVRVKRGQLLLELDDGLARAELGRAQASERRARIEAEQAEREAERFSELGRQQVVSARESALGVSEASARSAERTGAVATVSVMSERVARHRIVAPFDGTVSRRHVDPGDWLGPGDPALDLVTDGRVEVLVRVPAWLLDRLGDLEEARLIAGQREVAALVTSAVPTLDRQTRTALVRLDPKEHPAWLRAGSSVEVVFRTERDGGLSVPRDALVYGTAGLLTLVVVGSAVAIGAKTDQEIKRSLLIGMPKSYVARCDSWHSSIALQRWYGGSSAVGLTTLWKSSLCGSNLPCSTGNDRDHGCVS
jgi:RND family efflux transporter MFP subunit